MKPRIFEDDIKTGCIGEELFITTFKGVFEPVLKKIEFNLFPQAQRQGIDIIVSKESIEFDVKVRNNKYYSSKDILVETLSVVHKNKPGWIYYTRSPYIVYVWFNKFKTKFVDGYLIYLPHFKPFFEENINSFKQPPDATTVDPKTGRKWNTRNKIVPLNKIPSNCIQNVDMSLLGIKDQLLLSDYFEIEHIKKQGVLDDWI